MVTAQTDQPARDRGPEPIRDAMQRLLLVTMAKRLRQKGRPRPCIMQARIVLWVMANQDQALGGTAPVPNLAALARDWGLGRTSVSAAFQLLLQREILRRVDGGSPDAVPLQPVRLALALPPYQADLVEDLELLDAERAA